MSSATRRRDISEIFEGTLQVTVRVQNRQLPRVHALGRNAKGYNCPPNKIMPERNCMRRFAAVLLIVNLIVPTLAFCADQAPLAGYAPSSSATERDWETKFRTIPDPANLKEYMRRLSARPHHVGFPYDKDNAEWILARFKEWGLDAHIETFKNPFGIVFVVRRPNMMG